MKVLQKIFISFTLSVTFLFMPLQVWAANSVNSDREAGLPRDAIPIQFSLIAFSNEREKILSMHTEETEAIMQVNAERGLSTHLTDIPLGIGTYDLNNDGKKEIFALFEHSFFCGAEGCTTEIYETSQDGGYKLIFRKNTYGKLFVLPHIVKNGHQAILIPGSEDLYREDILLEFNGLNYIFSKIL